MRKNNLFLALFLFLSLSLLANDIVIKPVETPLVIGRPRNIITEIAIDNSDGKYTNIQSIVFNIDSQIPSSAFGEFELLYTGETSMLREWSTQWALKQEFQRIGGAQEIYASPRYAICDFRSKISMKNQISFYLNRELRPGINYFYVSSSIKKYPVLTDYFYLNPLKIVIDNVDQPFIQGKSAKKRLGVSVRNHMDDGVYSYRIPGIVTTKKGTLLSVYDVRYNTTLDLQDDIDVGLSRSVDGGLTWEKMKIIMDLGEYGGLPQGQNGIGDPSILVDEVTGDIIVVAVWTHGLKGARAWTSSGPGLKPEQTAQLMMTRSRDDGKTWSVMENITEQLKDSSWRFLLQGPGRGITMKNGTLVFPIQYIDSLSVPHAAIMYSEDRGVTWKTNTFAKANTTEAQVVEIEEGKLMLNMRDNNRQGRAVATTTDMGKTWNMHSSSNKSLPDPVCMASLYYLPATHNYIAKNVLLFSNPNESTPGKRWRMTIKASLDKGDTWNEVNSLLIDEDHSFGYSCLTMIDKQTVGILYESSVGHLVFQAFPLKEIVREK